jgi:ribosomal protein S18 acetylase RimI-like enzyme
MVDTVPAEANIKPEGGGIPCGENFIIRPVEERDLPALEWNGDFRHFRRLFRQAYEDMRLGSRQLLLLESPTTGEVIGQIFIQWNSSDPRYADGCRRGYLYALRVKPSHRDRGLGTRLLDAAEEELMRRGMNTASIGVEKNNPRARALYERQGYRIVAEDPGRWSYIDDEGNLREVVEPAWLMEKNLREKHP